jgi:hypothetical protein
MTPYIFAEWLRRRGQRVVRTPSSWWQDSGFGVYQAFPYHWLIEPTPEDLKQLFRQSRALAIRYFASSGSVGGVPGYHVTYEEPVCGFDTLSLGAQEPAPGTEELRAPADFSRPLRR